MSGFRPISNPRAIRQRVNFTCLQVESIHGTRDEMQIVVSGADDLSHVEDIFAVLWNDPDGVEVEWRDADAGVAFVELVELG